MLIDRAKYIVVFLRGTHSIYLLLLFLICYNCKYDYTYNDK